MPVPKSIKRREVAIKRLQRQGYSLHGSFNSRGEAKRVIKNLKLWGYKIKTVIFPNGVVMVYSKK